MVYFRLLVGHWARCALKEQCRGGGNSINIPYIVGGSLAAVF